MASSGEDIDKDLLESEQMDSEKSEKGTNQALDTGNVDKMSLKDDFGSNIDLLDSEERVRARLENLRALKNSQTAALGAVTKKRNDITKLLKDCENLHLVKDGLNAFHILCDKYEVCFEKHRNAIILDDDAERELQRFEDKQTSIIAFNKEVMSWIQYMEDNMSCTLSDVSSHKTRSSGKSRKSSNRSSSKESVKSAHLKEKAKLAELLIQKSVFQKEQKLREERDALDLDVKIAKAQAREKIFAEFEDADQKTDNEPSCIPIQTLKLEPEHESKPLSNAKDSVTQESVLPSTTSHLSPTSLSQNESDNLIMKAHKQMTTAMLLPQPEVPKFDGDPMAYMSFMMAFDSRIVPHATSDADKLYYLDQHLTGPAKDTIGGCVYMNANDGYQEARRILKKEYGDPYKVATAFINKAQTWATIKSDDNTELKKFVAFLTKCSHAMKTITHMSVLNHSPNMQMVLKKVPMTLQNKWREHVVSRRKKGEEATFQHIVQFLQSAVDAADDPVFGREAMNESIARPPVQPMVTKSRNFAIQLNTKEEQKNVTLEKGCLMCHNQTHDLDDCEVFCGKSLGQKRDFLKEKHLCFGCYASNHISIGCTQKKVCKICHRRHPTALHDDKFPITEPANPTNDTISAYTCSSTTPENITSVWQAILPVRVYQNGNEAGKVVETYAMYDNGSKGCFISEDLKEALEASATEATLNMQTMHGASIIQTKSVENLVVMDTNDRNKVELPKTFTRHDIPVSHSQIPKPELLNGISYLKPLADKLPAYKPSLEVGLLIGSSCPTALQPLQVVDTDGKGPYAALYRHGWTINGPLHVKVNPQDNSVTCNRIVIQEVQLEPSKEEVNPASVLKMFDRDFSEHDIGKAPGERGPSMEDRKFLEAAEKSITLTDGHFELPLPLRSASNDLQVKNNREQAEKRAQWQRKKMLKNDEYAADYKAFVEKLIAKGYAYEVPSHEISSGHPIWYLPHHGVYHPQKPGKIRVVFDCSAKFCGESLNDKLLQGPDLTNSLIGVLCRFRKEHIAFMADIEAMFHQIRVPDEQHDLLRFLWWPDGDLQKPLKEYRMAVHTFGAICSPSIANFALKAAADRAEEKYGPDVAYVIRRNFYVDDCLKSVKDEDAAKRMAECVTESLAACGFNLTKFTSTSKDLMAVVPKEDWSKELKSCDLDYDNTTMERALGLKWRIESDSFGYSIKLEDKPLTRRGLLSTICSLYDPLGFSSPVILPAKKMLREVCQSSNLTWDEVIPDELKAPWEKWVQDLQLLEDVKVNRCIKPDDFGNVVSYQLHAFSDASTVGYGVSVYIRLINDKGEIHVSLLMGKSRLAPMKMTTIPRLELTAASVAVKVTQGILQELDMEIDSVTYHTDSSTVLHYIGSERGRFPVFVANRVKQIRDFSSPQQWRYVPTNENPADIASRGIHAAEIVENDLWFHGPPFLQTDESSWVKRQFMVDGLSIEEESDSVTVGYTKCDDSCEPVQKLLQHYSSWYRLKRAVVIYRRFFKFLLSKQKDCRTFNVEEVQDAEDAIVKFVQKEAFYEEVETLRKNNSSGVLTRSNVYRLDPFMDRNGLIRVGGRLRNAKLDYNMKHPVLLPKKVHITNLVIRSTHEKLLHSGRNHVLSELREKYWVVHGNSAVRRVLYSCVTCRKLRGPCMTQKMSDLPKDRVNESPPFSHVGIDFFGPHTVKEGRKYVKRYGVIFTCLACRAVHIETSNTLSTDSFIHALRRFMSRRGWIKIIRCDNGTNFHGAERELRECLQEMDYERVQEFLLKHNISWQFNPPSASHMGGVWERMIRTVRKVLAPLLLEYGERLDDEAYRTLLCEVESIVNSRPLTVSEDPNVEPLTPNHLLTQKTSISPPPGNFTKDDMYIRQQWRRVQFLADLFWRRWRREYLAGLQPRQKWNKETESLKIGDIVLIKDDSLPRNEWSLGLVEDTVADSKGLVRSVHLKTQNKTLCRPIHKLVLLLKAE